MEQKSTAWNGQCEACGVCLHAQASIWAALSGIGLALVLPCVQAIIAELYIASERGRAFGALFMISALGEAFATVIFCPLVPNC
jgi:MFS family permease